MLANQKQYIVNLANLSNARQEVVGDLALFQKEELSAGIPIPMGFVVTSTAFDDFLVANDLIAYIAPRINDIDYSDTGAVRQAAEEIRKAINMAAMPQIIADPISKAYGGMSGFTEAGVNLLVSPLNEELKRSVSIKGSSRHQLAGIEHILNALKDLWADFFSLEALLYRHQSGYEGYLTEAVIVQKLLFPEVSGRLYTFNPTDNDPAIYEVQAIWGGEEADSFEETVPDLYFLEAATGDLIERKNVPQESMLIRKARFDGKSLFNRIKMSAPMQKRAKLDERNLRQLYTYAQKIKDLKDKQVELKFYLEGGRTYIAEVSEVDEELKITERFPLQPHLDKEIDSWGSEIEIIPGEPDLNPDDDYEYNPKAEAEFKKDLDNYVEELSEPAKEVQEQRPRFGQPVPTPQKEEPVAVVPEPVKLEPSEERVLVDIKPIAELQSLLEGKGSGSKARFGLSHLVLEDFDLEDLTGDEILVLKEISSANLRFVNAVRGAVVETAPQEEVLNAVKVPLIYGLKDVFKVIRDKEVITLDPQDGKILLGAGVKEEKDSRDMTPAATIPIDKEVPEIEARRTEPASEAAVVETTEKVEAPEVTEPVVETVEKEPQPQEEDLPELPQRPEPQLAVSEALGKPEAVEVEQPQRKGPELASAIPVNVFEDPTVAPLTSTSEFWQSVDIKNPRVDVKNTSGMIVCAEQLYEAWELEPESVYTDKYAFKTFLFQSAGFLKELILRSNGRTLIYQSASHEYLEKKNITEHVHDMILVDLQVVSWLRNRENLRNVWYSFADVMTAEYLADVKKNVSSEGIRRSAAFKLFAHISQPYAGVAVKSLVENGNIDGIIIDLDKLIPAMGPDFKELDENLANFLRFIIEIVNSNNSQVFLWNRGVTIDNAQIKSFLEKGLSNFVTPVDKVMETKLQVSDQELARLIKQKKRGRKRKKIDFGF